MVNVRPSRRGFTFVELCLGLVITSLVLGGVASFTLAVSTAWQNAGDTQAALLSANHAATLLTERIRPCALTGGWQAGSIDGSSSVGAGVLLWTGDTDSSGTVNNREILLIQHDPATHRINLYSAPATSANAVYSYSGVFSQAAEINVFKSGLTPKVLCNNVTGAVFYVATPASATSRPFVEFTLKISNASGTQTVYGDATLRSPLPVPTN